MRLFQTFILLIPGLLALQLLSACIAAPINPDPNIALAALRVHNDAERFFVTLKSTYEPECDYAHNANSYDQMMEMAGRLRSDLGKKGVSKPLLHAADALGRAISRARASHELASANLQDANGPCLDPTALTLNADAIMRASAAIAETQSAN